MEVQTIRRSEKNRDFLRMLRANPMARRLLGERIYESMEREYEFEAAGTTYELELPPWHARLVDRYIGTPEDSRLSNVMVTVKAWERLFKVTQVHRNCRQRRPQ